jgi:hypothetical protein
MRKMVEKQTSLPATADNVSEKSTKLKGRGLGKANLLACALSALLPSG